MAKITRKVAKVFGQDAGLDEIGKFGSLAAGTPEYETDPALIQSLSNWLGGWYSAVVGGNSPAIQDMNAFCFVMAYQIAYAMQTGVAEWNTDTVYYIGSLVNDGAGQMYVSNTDDNTANTLDDGVNWTPVGGGYTTDVTPATDVTVASGETLTYFGLEIEAAKEWTVDGTLVTGGLIVGGVLNVPGKLVVLY